MLMVIGLAWSSAPPASAQLGSLVVTMTAPASGATVSNTIAVNANVSIVGALTVAAVQFKLDGANLGNEDTSAPYSIQWNTKAATNGPHTLTAVARDLLGAKWTSSAVNVTVFNDVAPPTISITAPSAGAVVRGPVTFTAAAADNIGVAGVQFRIDGVNVGAEDTAAPYAISWDTASSADGSHALTAIARDAAGNVATAAAIIVTSDNSGPAVAITAPDGTAVVSGTITVAADATDNTAVAGVQFLLNGAPLGAEDLTAPFSTTWDTVPSGNSSHRLSAVARDGAGNLTTSASVWVSVVNDTASPSIEITSPANGATVSGSISVTASASDDSAVVGVQYFVDGATLGAEVVAGYNTTWDTTTSVNGSHVLTAVARDASGHTASSAAITVTVANAAGAIRVEDNSGSIAFTPSASWMEGYTDARGWSGGTAALGFVANQRATHTFSGTGVTWIGFRGPQTGIARVHLDGVLVATVDAYSPNEVVQASLYTSDALAFGTHTIAIEVTRTKNDAANDFYVIVDAFDVTTPGGMPPDSTAPTVSVTSPAGGATVSGAVSIAASAADNVAVAGVKFFVDGAVIGVEDTAAPYEIAWNASAAGEGSHTLTAEARDAAGNTALSAGVVVTVSTTDTAAPAVAISSPADNATVFGTASVTANATDNSSVAGVQFLVDGTPLGAEDTTAPYSASWDTTTAANGSHVLTARARDGAGNTALSAPITVMVANGAGSNMRIEDGNTAITYHGSWNVGNSSRPWSGGSAAVGFAIGQDAVVTFRGTGITWIGFQGPWAGIANVRVDGVLAATIDGYAPAEAVKVPVFSVSGLPLATHTLTVDVTRTKNAASSDFVVIVDAFDIIDAPPDATPPTVALTAPANGAQVFGTIPVKAGADDDSGVAAVTFFVDGVQLDAVDTISPYGINWNTTTIADGAHTLTAVARDAAGNTTTSTAVTVMVTNSAPPALASATRIENTDLGIVYVDGCTTCGQAPAWFYGSRSRTWSDGTASFNRAEGARASYTFTGTAVKWIGFRAAWAGIARVFVDGAFVSEIDLFSPTEEVQVPVFQVSDLVPGSHTITIEATGRRNPEATDYAVVLDAFDVSPGVPPPTTGTRSEESAQSATFTAGWNKTDTSQAWSGGAAAVTSAAAERATFDFTGTSVMWIGKRGPDMGIARVFLDGAFQAQIDSYYPVTIQGLVYNITGLAPGQHLLEIEATGLKHAQASGEAIAIDAFDVRSRIEENDMPVSYSGAWNFNDTARNWSHTSLTTGTGTASFTAAAGARAELTFSGSAVSWVGLRGPILGIADVYLDGIFAQQVDLYSTAEQVQAPLFTATGLAPGTHTLRVEATGTKNPAAATTRVYVDTFDVTLPSPAPRIGRVPDSDGAIAYSAGWAGAGASSLWSGGNAKETRAVGEQASFTFTGTAVRWIGERGFNTGLARVSIDGQFVALVDTRTPFQEEYQEAVFRAVNLAPGTHTLTIEVVGRNNEAAGSLVERVVIDAFDVYQQ